ncbi:MAG: hypothetical protein LAQ30_31790, partial [Acidobacteriia bacterium]|nr:hypothetical protein [Terriglobia bacterium]
YREIGDATYAKLQDLDRRGQEMVNETLRLGVRPDKARSKALWAERVAILKDGMQQMQNRMSAEGWKVVMREMMKGAWAGSTAAPPR